MKLNLIINEHKKVKRLDVGYGDSSLERIIYDPPKFLSEISLPIEPRVLYCTFEDGSHKSLTRENFNSYFNRQELKPDSNYNYEANLKSVTEFLEKNHMIYLLHREVESLIIPVSMAAGTIEGKGRTLLELIKEVPLSGVITDNPQASQKGFWLKFTDGCFVSYLHKKPYWDRFHFDVAPKAEKIVIKKEKEVIQLPPKIFEIHFFHPKATLFKTKYLKDYVKCNYKVKQIILDKFLLGGTVHRFNSPVDIETLTVPFYTQEVHITFEKEQKYTIKL